MSNQDVENIIVPAAGVHVMLNDHFSPDKMGLIVPKTSDGYVLCSVLLCVVSVLLCVMCVVVCYVC